VCIHVSPFNRRLRQKAVRKVPMIVVLNGRLGIGKSTLAEALTESIEYCVMLDDDGLVAAGPAASRRARASAFDNRAAGHTLLELPLSTPTNASLSCAPSLRKRGVDERLESEIQTLDPFVTL
jgi:hypothetical protein